MRRNHTKLWIWIVTLILAFGLLAGCSKKEKETSAATTTSETTTETTTAKEESSKETAESATEEVTEETKETTTEATTSSETTKKETTTTEAPTETTAAPTEAAIDEDGEYTSKDDVALYIYTYGHLPSNFVTKKEARERGWEGGSLEDYFPGCSIGGDVFGNREGLLPSKKGRTYYECDIDTKGKSSRGAKRIVFSDDGLIYYTEDHYETFTLLYGEE
ncbi:MAG: ribonuclease [Clostridiales bacterium]|nr:ribonuclease [Clostridiales bacterium]